MQSFGAAGHMRTQFHAQLSFFAEFYMVEKKYDLCKGTKKKNK